MFGTLDIFDVVDIFGILGIFGVLGIFGILGIFGKLGIFGVFGRLGTFCVVDIFGLIVEANNESEELFDNDTLGFKSNDCSLELLEINDEFWLVGDTREVFPKGWDIGIDVDKDGIEFEVDNKYLIKWFI